MIFGWSSYQLKDTALEIERFFFFIKEKCKFYSLIFSYIIIFFTFVNQHLKKKNMKKIILIFALFCSFLIHAQHTITGSNIIGETFNSSGCTTSINLGFTVNKRNNGYTDLEVSS